MAKAFIMIESRDELTDKELEDFSWKMMEGTKVYSATIRRTLEKLKDIIQEDQE